MTRRITHIGLIFIVIGVYLLLVELELGIPDPNRAWPAFPLAGGIAFLGSYLLGRQRDPDLVFLGTALTLSALFLFLITMGSQSPDYSVLNDLWPVFVVIAGISFMALWLAQGMRDWAILFLAILGIVLGGGSLAVNLDGAARQDLTRLWPAFLIIVGLVLLLRAILNQREIDR
ncbi:MAG: hypothetical protein PVH62_09020 [Anaerolineae bacterium]|jgi:hypothetical protein